MKLSPSLIRIADDGASSADIARLLSGGSWASAHSVSLAAHVATQTAPWGSDARLTVSVR